MASNSDKDLKINFGAEMVVGIGNFHKTLPHNEYGEVCPDKNSASKNCPDAFITLVNATEGNGAFRDVLSGPLHTPPVSIKDNPLTSEKEKEKPAPFVNPQAGLASDRLTQDPNTYDMPPAPGVLSETAAAEMTELYWMALLRDISFDTFASDAGVAQAASDIQSKFQMAVLDKGDGGHLKPGVDVPGGTTGLSPITHENLFRMGLPGEEVGPFVSQFFVRRVNFGTQTIDQKQRPYKAGRNYLTKFQSWLDAQNSGNGDDGLPYPHANEARENYYEAKPRYISTMRDLARFVHKDALHQAYFNAALLLLSGGAKWTPGNPYGDTGSLKPREAGFGTLGGPHILALVSEVATRALKIVWHQKWQVHLRLRPEAYGGLVHVQEIGAPKGKRAYGLPDWVAGTEAAVEVRKLNASMGEETLLLPMAFTSGSPVHPAYGAGHATVAGACVTVLKAFFKTLDITGNSVEPLPLSAFTSVEGDKGALMERLNPYDTPIPFRVFKTGTGLPEARKEIPEGEAQALGLTIEGELNKLAMNVAMGRCMGGVHWRTDNTRSLMLGEAIATYILAEITVDLAEKPKFEFRTFARDANGNPRFVTIEGRSVKVQSLVNGQIQPEVEQIYKSSSSLWKGYI